MNYKHLLVSFFTVWISNAQQFPLDFEGNQFPFTGFSNASFSFRGDPVQATNDVGQFFNDGSQATQGFFIDLSMAVDLSADQVITLKFYSFDPNAHSILLKLESGTQSDVQVLEQLSGSQNTWNTVSFDFSNATEVSTGNTISAMGQYSRVTLFIDYGSSTPGTYLIDDINNGATVTNPNQIDVVYTDLVWSDEFNTTGLLNPIEATKWHHQTQMITPTGWANGEQQHYTNRLDNSYVENGYLHIVAKSETYTDQGETKQYTSARLNSKFAFTYGRVDVRAKLPAGDGTWPAIWMLGKNINEDGGYWDSQYGTTGWPLCGEIDIMEHGLGAVNQVSAALHTNCAGCSGATMNYMPFMLTDVVNNFHVYSMNWSPQQITFLIDDVPFYTYNPTVRNIDTWPFDEDQYLLLNVAMGGIAGAIDPNFVQSSMVVDYVRVYQNVLSTEENTMADAVTIYPNPARDIIYINTIIPLDKIELYNMMGQLVKESTTNLDQLIITDQHSSIYLLKMYSGSHVYSERVSIK